MVIRSDVSVVPQINQMSLPHSGHRMSSRSVRKPRPTRDTEHFLQLKQSLCHWRSSKEMYLLPPRPEREEDVPFRMTLNNPVDS